MAENGKHFKGIFSWKSVLTEYHIIPSHNVLISSFENCCIRLNSHLVPDGCAICSTLLCYAMLCCAPWEHISSVIQETLKNIYKRSSTNSGVPGAHPTNHPSSCVITLTYTYTQTHPQIHSQTYAQSIRRRISPVTNATCKAQAEDEDQMYEHDAVHVRLTTYLWWIT